MKIEVELLKIDQDTDKARACVVALLCALPRDDAELAMEEWQVVQHVRDLDAEGQRLKREAAADPFAAARTALERVEEAATIPPQDAGYSEAPPPVETITNDGVRDHELVTAAKAMHQHPDYEVGGWVLTDQGELAKIIGRSNCFLVVEVDEGEQSPTEKMISVDQVRPATKTEMEAGRATTSEEELGVVLAVRGQVDRTAAALPERPGSGEKKKRARPRKAAVDSAAVDSAPSEPAPPKTFREAHAEFMQEHGAEIEQIRQDQTEKYAEMPLKNLCKLAEHHAGRPKVWELFEEHGVTRLGADAAKDADLRAAVLELVP